MSLQIQTVGTGSDSEYQRAGLLPSLDLKFAETKSLTDAISGQNLITFTRASSATVINAAGALETVASNVPRFDHNPITGESLGLLVEEQRTNLLLRSEEFDSASWIGIGSIVSANAIASPSGAVTSDLLREDASTGLHEIFQVGTSGASTYTLSVFFKNGSGTRHLNLGASRGSLDWISCRFNPVNGTASAVSIEGNSFTSASAQIVSRGDGWYRGILTFTSAGSFAIQTALSSSSAAPASGSFGVETYQGDNSSGIYLWGAQLEAGAFPTSYIPTTTAAATRSADVVSITGASFSSWYRQDEGTVFAETSTLRGTGPTLVVRSSSTENERIQFVNANGQTAVVTGGGALFFFGGNSNKQAFSYANNNFAQKRLGVSLETSLNGTVPTVDYATIGRFDFGGGDVINGSIRRLIYIPTAISKYNLDALVENFDSLFLRSGSLPALDLRFSSSRSLTDSSSGRNLITFTRASSGTYVGSDGVLKTATTNLLLRSEEFDNANWVKNNGCTITQNNIAAPNGALTADRFNGTAQSATGVYTVATTLSGLPYTFSVYIKNAANATTLRLGIESSPVNAFVTFNASTGSITFQGANVTSSFVQSVGDGWYRVTVTYTSTGASPGVVIYSMSGLEATWYAWGAQLEQSATVGEYIPTTSTINSAPRFDHNPVTGESLGLLVEESRTNSIRNNTMVGAVAGTPGTLPTNWANASINGITREIVGIGTEDGIPYIDFRFSGTNTLGSNYYMDITFETGTTSVAQGQTWTESVYVKLISGTISGAAFSGAVGLILYGLPSFNDNTSLRPLPATNARLSSQRFSVSRTFTNAGTTGASPRISWAIATGATIDFTLRIGMPQLEQGAFATSVIPTAGATATRSADVASITGSNFSSWYRQDEGTVFADAKEYPFPSSSSRVFYVIDNSAAPNTDFIKQWIWNGNTSLLLNSIYTSSGGPIAAELSRSIVNENKITALAFKLNDFARSYKGAAVLSDVSGNLPIAVDRLAIGRDISGQYLSGHLRRITYWPQRLPNNTLIALTR